MFRSILAASAVALFAIGAARPALAEGDIVDTAVGAGQFNTLVAAVQTADLVDTLKDDGPFTVFAPTDEAFAALPEGTVESLLKPENKAQLQAILTYHVVSGAVTSDQLAGKTLDVETMQGATVAVDGTDGVKVNDANVIAADVKATNGVIHVIDAVLLPPEKKAEATGDIVDVAVSTGQFNTLVAALKTGGLDETLKGDGPFTVFAPTDKAFAKLPEGAVESLLKTENNDDLAKILKYHVIAGEVTSDQLVGKKLSAKTVEGHKVRINGTGAKVVVNGSIVEAADVKATNGVIHVVDTVLVPDFELVR